MQENHTASAIRPTPSFARSRRLGTVAAAAVTCALFLGAAAPVAAQATGDVVVGIGVREGTEGTSSPMATLRLNAQGADWPVAVFVALQGADDLSIGHDESDLEVEVSELDLGIAKKFRPGRRFQPLLAGGVALLDVSAQLRIPGDDVVTNSTETAFFGLAGARWEFGHFTTGIDVRLSYGGKVTAGGVSEDLDAWDAAWVLGFGW